MNTTGNAADHDRYSLLMRSGMGVFGLINGGMDQTADRRTRRTSYLS